LVLVLFMLQYLSRIEPADPVQAGRARGRHDTRAR